MSRWILCLFMLFGCASQPEGLVEREYGDVGSIKSYELFVPSRRPRRAPLVVALHRFTDNGKSMAKLTSFHELASREGFVVVYPSGPMRRFEAFHDDGRDDVAMVLAVIEDVAKAVKIDRRRIYVTGASNGAFLTHRLACLAPETFAAAAPVMALMPASLAESFPDGPPMPMLIVHGTEDRIVKPDAKKLFAGASYAVLPIEETVAYWVRRNGAGKIPKIRELDDVDPDDETRVTLFEYAGPAEVRYYRVDGGGHTWPGGDGSAPKFIVGRTSRDFSATETIWEFFRGKSR